MNEKIIYFRFVKQAPRPHETPWNIPGPLYKFTKNANGCYCRSYLVHDEWIYDGMTLAASVPKLIHDKIIKIVPESEVMLELL